MCEIEEAIVGFIGSQWAHCVPLEGGAVRLLREQAAMQRYQGAAKLLGFKCVPRVVRQWRTSLRSRSAVELVRMTFHDWACTRQFGDTQAHGQPCEEPILRMATYSVASRWCNCGGKLEARASSLTQIAHKPKLGGTLTNRPCPAVALARGKRGASRPLNKLTSHGARPPSPRVCSKAWNRDPAARARRAGLRRVPPV